MNYTVKYRLPGDLFWRKIKDVKGDTFVENGMRLIITETEERFEIPLSAVVMFSRNRFFSILENKRKETGQKLDPNTKAKPE